MGSLLAALATLEQVRGGMVCGRIASPAELEAARAEALRLVNDHLIAAARASPGEARAAAGAFPSWARPLVDSALLAALADAAAADNAAPPGDVSAGPFGRFSWSVEAGCYVAKQPLCVGAASLTLSVSDVEPEELPGRLAELPWLRLGLLKVVEKAKLFAAQNGLEMHNGGYAGPESADRIFSVNFRWLTLRQMEARDTGYRHARGDREVKTLGSHFGREGRKSE